MFFSQKAHVSGEKLSGFFKTKPRKANAEILNECNNIKVDTEHIRGFLKKMVEDYEKLSGSESDRGYVSNRSDIILLINHMEKTIERIDKVIRGITANEGM